MKFSPLPLTILLCLCPVAAQAQVHVGIEIGLPPVLSLSVVAPGIQVVEGFPGEVFLQGGCPVPEAGRLVPFPLSPGSLRLDRCAPGPTSLNRMPAGRYHNWHHGGAVPASHSMDQHQAGHGRMEANPHHGEGEPGHQRKS